MLIAYPRDNAGFRPTDSGVSASIEVAAGLAARIMAAHSAYRHGLPVRYIVLYSFRLPEWLQRALRASPTCTTALGTCDAAFSLSPCLACLLLNIMACNSDSLTS